MINCSMPSIDTSLDGFSHNFVYDFGSGVVSLNPGDATALGNSIKKFWDSTAPGATNNVNQYLSGSLNQPGGMEVKLYDITGHLDGSVHGPPVQQALVSWATTTASTSVMPEGVAGALSFARAYGTDPEFVRDPTTHKVIARPRMRDRGRFFIGPLNATAMIQDATTRRTKLSSVFMTDVQRALISIENISGTVGLTGSIRHWSKKKADVQPIVQSWVDDRPDYQRRRSDQSTVRNSIAWSSYP